MYKVDDVLRHVHAFKLDFGGSRDPWEIKKVHSSHYDVKNLEDNSWGTIISGDEHWVIDVSYCNRRRAKRALGV